MAPPLEVVLGTSAAVTDLRNTCGLVGLGGIELALVGDRFFTTPVSMGLDAIDSGGLATISCAAVAGGDL